MTDIRRVDLTDDIDLGIAIRELCKSTPSNTELANAVRGLLTEAADAVEGADVARAVLDGLVRDAILDALGAGPVRRCAVRGGTMACAECPGGAAAWYPGIPSADVCELGIDAADVETLVTGVLALLRGVTGYRRITDAYGMAQAARASMAKHSLARREGRADALGLDPTDRRTSWAGRYDGGL